MRDILISIDWDYFFDWVPAVGGVGEFYEQIIWGNQKLHPPNLCRLTTFWDTLQSLVGIYPNTPIVVTKDHHDIYKTALNYQNLVVFDFHNDSERGDQIGCDTWLRHWQEVTGRKSSLVLPNDAVLKFEAARVNNSYWPTLMCSSTHLPELGFPCPAGEVQLIHICQSPGWTHPLADPLLKDFVTNSPVRSDAVKWNPLTRKHLVLTADQILTKLMEESDPVSDYLANVIHL